MIEDKIARPTPPKESVINGTAMTNPGKQLRYTESHPWLRFEIDREALHQHPGIWHYLGQCCAMSEELANAALRPDQASFLYTLFLAKGVQGTVAIEGNTLTEDDVLNQIEGTLEVSESQKYQQQEVRNIIEACTDISEIVLNENCHALTWDMIQKFNRQVMTGLEIPDHFVPGEVPAVAIGVGRYKGAPRSECEYLCNKLCSWLDSDAFNLPDYMHPAGDIVKAIVAHLYFELIHPFGDGNGRTGRLIEFFILMASGMPAPATHLLSNHYNKTRTKYFSELTKVSKSGGDILPFIEYALQGMVDGLQEQLHHVRNCQLEESWKNFVYSSFPEHSTGAQDRRRLLVLELSKLQSPVPRHAIDEATPKIAKTYAKLASKTLTRDLNELQSMDLVGRSFNGYFANKDKVRVFLPRRASGPDEAER